MTDAPVPLTIIGGFLGAGKTTLLRRILAAPQGRRIGVAINDFGALNIDAMLVAGQTGPVVSLANGCACCQIGDSLIDALFALRAAPERPDAIVVEASGVADPRKLAQLGRIGRFFRWHATVVVVDAANVQTQAADPLLADTVTRQLAAADLLLLNKIDLVDGAALDAVERWLHSVAPTNRILRCVDAAVPTELLLDSASPSHGLHCAEPDDAAHGDVFRSWTFEADRPFDAPKLRALLSALPNRIIRGKGILFCDDQPERQTVFHRVGTRVELTLADAWPGPTRSTRLVLIGVGAELDEAALDQAFRAALR